MPARLPWPLVFQVLGTVAAVWLVVHTWPLWLLVGTAGIVAAAILPAARAGERYRIPRLATVLAVYLAVAGVLGLLGRLLWPALREQWSQFLDQLPRLVDNVRGWLVEAEFFLGRWGASLPTPQGKDLDGLVQALIGNTLSVTAGVFGAAVGLLAILAMAAYFVMDADRIGATGLALLPPAHRPPARALAEPVLDRVGGYVRGQLVASAFVGVLIAIGLGLLGVRYALLIGALAAVLNVVPFVGGTVAAVLGILSALNHSLVLAVAAAAVLGGVQLVEGKLLAPHFVGRATGLHPLVVLLALLAGAQLAGLVGALVAVPAMAALWEIVRVLWVLPHATADSRRA